MRSSHVYQRLIMILLAGSAISCSNAIPTVDSLTVPTTTPTPVVIAPRDAKNFVQINAGSKKETIGTTYKGNIRISQPLGDMQATSSQGYKLKGTVTLQR